MFIIAMQMIIVIPNPNDVLIVAMINRLLDSDAVVVPTNY